MNMQVLNDTYAVELRHLIRQGEREASDAQFISIDRLGADVRARFGTDYSVERVGFDKVTWTPHLFVDAMFAATCITSCTAAASWHIPPGMHRRIVASSHQQN